MADFLEILLGTTVIFGGIALATGLLVIPIIFACTMAPWVAWLEIITVPLALLVMAAVVAFMEYY